MDAMEERKYYRYILFSDLEDAEEMDDGIFLVQTKVTEDTDPAEANLEPFSEGDLYKIRTLAPSDADGIAYTDDWVFYNSQKGLFFDYVFRD